jgi:hypothetical protein
MQSHSTTITFTSIWWRNFAFLFLSIALVGVHQTSSDVIIFLFCDKTSPIQSINYQALSSTNLPCPAMIEVRRRAATSGPSSY